MPLCFSRFTRLSGICLLALAFAPLGARAAEPAALLLDFQAAAQAGRPDVADAWRTPAVRNAQRTLYPLPSLDASGGAGPMQVFSAAEAWIDGAGALDLQHGDLKLHPNNPPGWPDEPCLFWTVSESTGGQHLFHSTWVNLWNKAQFTGLAGGDARVRLGPGSRLAVTYTAWTPEFRKGALPAQIRFVVRNAGTTYVSEFAYTELIDAPRRIELADAASTRWAPVSWTAESFRVPGQLEFRKVEFEDVEAVGWVQQNSGSHLRVYRWNRFEFSAHPQQGAASYARNSKKPDPPGSGFWKSAGIGPISRRLGRL